MKLILTCEHAGNQVPELYSDLFKNAQQALDSHRGFDPGALDLFLDLRDLAVWHKAYMITRLLIEPNRSLHHPGLFSEFSQNLSGEEKQELIRNYFLPYRREVEDKVLELLEAGEKVLHLSVHSFTPQLNGEVRNADIGLLYDPARGEEKELAARFRTALSGKEAGLKVRYNYPYLGKADGFTTYLRRRFKGGYLGIELEVNQKFVKDNALDSRLKRQLYEALKLVVEDRE